MIERTGGPEVIEWREADLPDPGAGEVRMRHTAVGLNYIDAYYRSGLYPAQMPSGLGSEAAGVIEAVGEGVSGFAAGDRVATFGPPIGAYATARNLPATSLFKLPDDIEDRTAAAILLEGVHHRIPGRTLRPRAGGADRAGPCGGGRGGASAGRLAQGSGRDRDRQRRQR